MISTCSLRTSLLSILREGGSRAAAYIVIRDTLLPIMTDTSSRSSCQTIANHSLEGSSHFAMDSSYSDFEIVEDSRSLYSSNIGPQDERHAVNRTYLRGLVDMGR